MPIKERSVVDQREEMVHRAMDERYTVTEVAQMYGVSRPTVRLWRDRYRADGRSGLSDLSHAPHSSPHRTNEFIEQLVVEERLKYGWGSKKILARLQDAHPDMQLPKRGAVDAILNRWNLVKKSRRQKSVLVTPFRRAYTATEPAELMTIDHKGQFRLLNGKYCYPLTMMDSVSRYLLACEALESTSFCEAWPVIELVFRTHGLPIALQSDNGPPFGSPNGRFSTLSVRLMKLGVLPVFGRPGHPQDNGRHERMHRDLKRETTRPPGETTKAQQIKLDKFLHEFNVERPHESLGMKRPVNVFKSSPRPYPRRPPKPEYPLHFETRKVRQGGAIKWRNHSIFLTEPLVGETVGLESTDEGIVTVHFYSFTLGKIDERQNKFL